MSHFNTKQSGKSMLGRGLKNIKAYSLMSSPFSCPLHSRPSAGQEYYGMWQQSQRPICSEYVKVNDIMAEETVLSSGSLQEFLSVTQDHLWCLLAISFIRALSTAIFLVELEVCRNGNTSFWWSSVGQQINAIDADNVGGPPGSPAGFVEIKQVFLPKTHFIRKLVSGCIQLGYSLSVLALEDRKGGKK